MKIFLSLILLLTLSACQPTYIHDSSTGCIYEEGTWRIEDKTSGICAQWDRFGWLFEGEEVIHK
ncbi:MAG: hypothetical protein KAR40_11290 [Candidatus Sabulitectum sp.]|nr:hypothetical protein [Candidatus Sabulitectum sp.]